jgi:phosphohistidine phosphatase
MAAHLRREGVAPALILCSTSARTRQTLARVAPAFDRVAPVLFERELYGASAERLLARLHGVPDDAGSVMLVAHSSGIEDLALLLAARGSARSDMREKFPTGALATLELGGSWRSLGAGGAELVAFVTPRQLSHDADPARSG